ncbi:MAG: phasin family protein [Oscillospiraceae bacterium]|nr:phasin family protein [Oscillospiraceae bacterium]
MSIDFSENIKKVMLLGIGAMAATAEKSKDLIDEFVKKGELTVEQGKTLNEELKHNIKEKVDNVSETIFSCKCDKAADTRVSADEIISSIDSMNEEEIAAIKAKLDAMNQKTDEVAEDEKSV